MWACKSCLDTLFLKTGYIQQSHSFAKISNKKIKKIHDVPDYPINQKTAREKNYVRQSQFLKKGEGGGCCPARYDHDHRLSGVFMDPLP